MDVLRKLVSAACTVTLLERSRAEPVLLGQVFRIKPAAISIECTVPVFEYELVQ